MRRFIAIASGLAAIALLIYGMIQPVEEDTRWLLAVWLAAPLMWICAWSVLPARQRGVQRSVQNIGLVVLIGFLLLSLQLLRQQFVYAEKISNLIYVDDQTGQTTSNVRRVFEALRRQRGRMFDQSGALLVDTKIVEGNFAVRTYPYTEQYNPASFSNIVGFFSHRYLESGLEASYGPYLNGQRDTLNGLRDDMLGRQRVGDDLHLTIDAQLQAAAYDALAGRVGSAVVLDSKTGAVLAMVSSPGFDPRALAFDPSADRQAQNESIENYWIALTSDGSNQPLLNRPTQSRYPPGSVFKTVTAVSALEHAREARPNEIDCPNQRETENGAPPVVNAVDNLFEQTGNPSDLEHVYAFSCNTAFAEYAMRLGPDLLMQTAQKFDIFAPTLAPAPYAEFTDLPTSASLMYVEAGFLNSRAALADTGFGQGQLLITPLQMAMVAATVANNGVMMQPYLVEKITRPDTSIVAARSPRSIRRVMSEQTASEIQKDMRAAVTYGFGKSANTVPNAGIGGKSGTAEYPCPTPDAPGRICTHAWFIAIGSVQDKQVAVAVMVEGGGEGSSVGASLAGQVLAAAFR